MAAPTASVKATTTSSVPLRVLGVLVAGAAVSVLLGVYANEHTPTREKPYTLVFTDTIQLKVWFATAAFVLAVVQVLLALRIYGKLRVPRTAPPWLGTRTGSPGSSRSRSRSRSPTTASGRSGSSPST